MVNAAMQLVVLQCTMMALFGQVETARQPAGRPPSVSARLSQRRAMPTSDVTAQTLEVYDRPDEASYITGVLNRGDRIKIRERLDEGWLAIDPPPNTICWVEASTIESIQNSVGRNGHVAAGGSTDGKPARAVIATPQAIIRSGNLGARLPGPPKGRLSHGTVVRLLDREPVEIGRGASRTVWRAILPPPSVACYIRSGGTRQREAPPTTETAASPAVYTAARYAIPGDEYPPLEGLPAAVATEIKAVDAVHQSIRTGQPVARWRLDTVRSSYAAILKKAGDDPRLEEAIRVRLARVTRDEQAAKAARTIEEILAQSHRRDQEVAAQRRRVAAAGRSSARTFSAVGYMQASAEKIDGRKLYVLIGKDGSTLAYLDVPPGLEIDRLVAHRVGVRGDPHYNEELGSRLITVRDLEKLESRR